MKLDEIITADEKMKLARLIFNNTFNQLANELPQTPRPVPKPMAKPITTKIKPRAPKRAPMAPPPKPLPKAKPIPKTPTQIKHQQHKHQHDLAQTVKKTFDRDNVKMPKSLQPLTRNIISPIGGGDTELNKKLDLARKDYELQNRDSESKPWFPE
jgi:outer membrane biosynthesis protein TonB